LRIVLDTNVLLAAFGSHGLCSVVFEACLLSHEIVLSEHILDEFRQNAIKKFKLPADRVERDVRFLRHRATLVTPVPLDSSPCRDLSDVPVLGTALAGGADCLVTGDKELLELGRIGHVEILTPRGLHNRLCPPPGHPSSGMWRGQTD